MLRHIVLVSLAMTACASLIPTKANAFVTFTLEPSDGLLRNPGEEVEFVLKARSNPGGVDQVLIRDILHDPDDTELSFVPSRPHKFIDFNRTFSVSSVAITIANFFFKVDRPVKDGVGDITATVRYRENGVNAVPITLTGGSTLDVQPVPEPLTILGAATALGYGAILKRKSSKKTVS